MVPAARSVVAPAAAPLKLLPLLLLLLGAAAQKPLCHPSKLLLLLLAGRRLLLDEIAADPAGGLDRASHEYLVALFVAVEGTRGVL